MSIYQLLEPKFKYTLFVESDSNHFNDENKLTCLADSYEIKEDGSITFYQTGITEQDKKFKLPVLSYPRGKWLNCTFLDLNGNYPVFEYSEQEDFLTEQEPPEPEEEEEVQYKPTMKQEPSTEDESLNDMLSMLEETPDKSEIDYKSLSPSEFKERKTEWFFELTNQYLKTVNRFDLDNFMPILESNRQYEIFKVDETEVVWLISNFIRDKMMSPRKFSTPEMQKVFGFILKDIMKRQWDGKVSTILEILNEKEETEYANAIDLAVWMVQNGY